MFGVLRAKVRELALGDKGSALALTLAFLLPTYLVVIGIYGVSETVHRKIELQNAADAAAYSAATVQAEYLSRIAVLNKAVAWSYADMTRRQLDWAIASFTDQTLVLFEEDFAYAQKKNSKSCHPRAPGINWNAGYTPQLLKDLWPVSLPAGASVGIPQLLETFLDEDGFFTRFTPILAIYQVSAELQGKGVTVNTLKIAERVGAIIDCEAKLTDYIEGGEMKSKIEAAAKDLIELNTREIDDEVLRYVRVGDPKTYITPLLNTGDDEKVLLEHGLTLDKEGEYAPSKLFGKGIGYWFPRGDLTPIGTQRVYKHQKHYFEAGWSYFWTRWWHFPWPVDTCVPPLLFSSYYGSKTRRYKAWEPKPYVGFTDNTPLGYVVPPAIAFTLNQPGNPLGTHFGKEGTIVVGLARKNTNPLRIFGAGGGVDRAFDEAYGYDGRKRPEYIWAVSAARAAYNAAEGNTTKKEELKGKLESPSYRLDYTEPSWNNRWNLKETDWEAMYVPVRQANALTRFSVFLDLSGEGILKEVMTDKNGWEKKDGDKWKTASVDWSKLPPPAGGGFKAGSKLDWDELSKCLRH